MKVKFGLFVITVLVIAGMSLSACGTTATQAPAVVQPTTAAAAPTTAAAAPTKAPTTAAAAPTTAAAAPTTAPAAGPVTLTYMDTSGFYTLDIFQTPWFTAAQGSMYDTLVALTPDGKTWEGILAKSWELGSDNLSVTFKLKDGVKFHDGTPWNADAALWNLNKYLDPAWPKDINGQWPDIIASFEKVDDMTVKANLKTPYAAFFSDLYLTYMVSPTAYEQLGADNFGLKPIGTGPWIPTEIVPNDHILYKRNADYTWGGSWTNGKPPAADFFRIDYNTDQAVAYAALETGEISFTDMPPQFLTTAASNPNIKVHTGTSGTLYYLGINNKKEPFTEPKFRQAIAFAIERDEIILAAFEGQAFKTCQFVPAGTPGYNADTDKYACDKFAYDPAKSNQILDELGWKDTNGDGVRERNGAEMVFPIIYNTEEAIGRAAEVIQGQLSDIGIKLELNPMEAAAQATILVAEGQDFFIRPYGLADPSIVSSMATYIVDAQGKLVQGNRNAYNNAGAMELAKAADGAMDNTVRMKAVDALNRYLIDDNAWFPLWTPYTYVGYRTEVQGLEWDFQGGAVIHNATVVKP